MKSRTFLKEGFDYTISRDANGKTDRSWQVKLKTGPYKGLIGRYVDIEINGDKSAINYKFEPILIPPGMDQRWTPTFDAIIRDLLMNIIQSRHEMGENFYIDKKSGVRVDV